MCIAHMNCANTKITETTPKETTFLYVLSRPVPRHRGRDGHCGPRFDGRTRRKLTTPKERGGGMAGAQ